MSRVLVLVSPNPRDFTAAGLRYGSDFSEFSESALTAAIQKGGVTVLAGRAVCPSGTLACDESFGAALFDIEEIAGAKPAALEPANKRK
jgi:hypothetical protein